MKTIQNPQKMLKNEQNLQISQTKTQVFSLLLANRTKLWQHFTTSILNHLESNGAWNKFSKQEPMLQQEWVKNQIQIILKWISDPKNRVACLKYKSDCKIWEKQRKQWENTFQYLLQNDCKNKHKYQVQISQLQQKLQKTQEYCAQLKAKNTVLEAALSLQNKNLNNIITKQFRKQVNNKNNKHNKSIKQENHPQLINKSSNLKIFSEYEIQIPKTLNTTERSKKESVSMMNMESMTNDIILPIFQSPLQSGQMPVNLQLHSNFMSINQIEGSKKKLISVNQQIQTSYFLQQIKCFSKYKQQNIEIRKILRCQNKGTQTQNRINNKKLKYDSNTYSIQYIKQKQQKQLNKQETNTTENNNSELDQSLSGESACSSSSSYILECDTCIQTQTTVHHTKSTQTIPSPDLMIPQILLKMSQIQAAIQEKDRQIQLNSVAIEQMQRLINQKQIQNNEIREQITLGTQIYQHTVQKYQQMKLEYEELQEKYRDVLSKFLIFMSDKLVKFQQTVDGLAQTDYSHEFGFKEATTANSLSQSKSDHLDDQLLTIQSEQQQLNNFPQPQTDNLLIQKTVVAKYLMEYIKLQMQNKGKNSKLSVLLTLLEILGTGPLAHQDAFSQQQIVLKYLSGIKKWEITGFQKNQNLAGQRAGLQQKLFKYLTSNQ